MAKQVVFTSLRRFYSSSTYLTNNVAISSKRRQSTEIVKPKINVRFAERGDMPVLFEMIRDLNIQDTGKDCQYTLEELIEAGFCSKPWYFILIAKRDDENKIFGYILGTQGFSSLTGRTFHLEDLYVINEERANGIARKLMYGLGKFCVENQVKAMDWHVLLSNHHALEIYRHVGAKDIRETENRATMKLDERFVRKLARLEEN